MQSLFLTILVALFPVLSTVATMGQVGGDMPNADTSRASYARTIILAVDVSDAMQGSSLTQMQATMMGLINQLDTTTAVGIVTFGSSVTTVQSPTTDRAVLTETIKNLTAKGKRLLYEGALTAVRLANDTPSAERAVVVISCGWEYSETSTVARKDAVKLAVESNIPVYTIGIGKRSDRTFLETLSTTTKGTYYAANSAYALSGIGQQLAAAWLTPEGVTFAKASAKPETNETWADLPVALVNVNGTSRNATESGIGAAAIVLTFDTSDLMAGSAFTALQQAGRAFVDSSSSDTQIAIVTYSNSTKVIQNFTTDKRLLTAAIDELRMGGHRDLYNGALTAVKLAADAPAPRRIVVLLNAGWEHVENSAARRADAANYAKTSGVTVHAIGIGTSPDPDYLANLATASAGTYQQVKLAADLVSIYTTLGQSFSYTPHDLVVSNNPVVVAAVNAATDGKTSAVTVAPSGPVIAPIGAANTPRDARDDSLVPTTNAANASISVPRTETGAPIIAPLAGSISGLGLNQGSAAEAVAIQPQASPLTDAANPVLPVPKAAPANTDAQPTINTASNTNPTQPQGPLPKLGSNILPLRFTVQEGLEVVKALVNINGYQVASFDQAPYEFSMDTSGLSAGQYNLEFAVVNGKGVISKGSVAFDVVVETVAEQAPAADAASQAVIVSQADEPNGKLTVPVAPLTTVRKFLIDGKELPFNFVFSMENGLTAVPLATANTVNSPVDDLTSILARPVNLLPLPVREALTYQNPGLWTLVILIMTVILLPQGLFTMYWMLYTWNNPRIADDYRSPRQFVEPQQSFTAILPARKEENVIQDTIRAIDAIRYPDHLKEILVMIRDDDDDDTLRAAQHTINELKQINPAKNIQLLTFKDGPKNKPNGLNKGLAAASKGVITVFDAEDHPHPDIYNIVNTVMVNKGADVVQSGVQLMNFRSNWFSALNCLEYFFWFKSGLHCFTRKFKVTPLGGNTVFFKREQLEAIGGWDMKCLTEDADVGLRLTQRGAKIHIVYDEEHVTKEETPSTAQDFIRQRARWCQGFFQVFFKGDWAKLPSFGQKLTALYILLNSLLQALTLIYAPIGVYIALTQRLPVVVALVSWLPIFLLVVQMVTNLIGIREFTAAYKQKMPLFFSLRMVLFYYPYQLLLAISALSGLSNLIMGKNAWAKTTHSNLHREVVAAPTHA